jgi:hypothetical protein
MALKPIVTSSGATYHLGRKVPKFPRRGLNLGNYFTKKYVQPPAARDWSAKAMPSLNQMYLNDSLSDCVIACGAHYEGVVTGNTKISPIIYTKDQIIQQYSAIGDYILGNAKTDNGCELPTALDYWQNLGFAGGTKIATWVKVDATDKSEVQAAINEFGYLMTGICLPDEWLKSIGQLRTGYVWDIAGNPVPDNGHCMGIVGYDDKTIIISTWGMLIRMTYEALAKYAIDEANGELYALISTDWINVTTKKSPAGINWSQLVSDIESFK